MTSRNAGSEPPIPCRVAPAGLVSGPRKLKIVRTASSLRTGTTKRVAPWWAGANMNPKPACSMQRATASGARSIRTPSASRTSAEPDRPVAERLPCLATAHPAPAAMSAAVVETLKVWRPPPVPAVSIRSPRVAAETVTGEAKRRMVEARPTSSSTVSPFVRNAMSTAAVSGSDALPAMISASTAPPKARGGGLGPEEAAEGGPPRLGEAAHDLDAHARLVGRARARGDDDAVRAARKQGVRGLDVVAH